MEQHNALWPGSAAYVVARLSLWARRAPKGFASVRYADERSRANAAAKLRYELEAAGTSWSDIVLEAYGAGAQPQALAIDLVERLAALAPGVVSISGLAGALAPPPLEAHALYALNFYREAMARGGLRQIWWITPAVADRFSQCLPDLDSCFMVKLDLTETAPAVPEGDAKP